MLTAMSNVGLESSRFTTGNIEDLKVDVTQLQTEIDETRNDAQILYEVLDKISGVLNEINSSGGFKFNGLDTLTSSLEEVRNLLNDISDSLKSGISINQISHSGQSYAISPTDQTDILSGSEVVEPFDDSDETPVFDSVTLAAEEAAQAKEEFTTANKGVQDSVDVSKSKLELEAELMQSIAENARKAADAKKEFVEANKEVKASADVSSAGINAETDAIEENTNASKDNNKNKRKSSKSKEKVPSTYIKDIYKAWDKADAENNERTGKTLLKKYEDTYTNLLSKSGKTAEYQVQLDKLQEKIEEIKGLVPIDLTDNTEIEDLKRLDVQTKELIDDLSNTKKYDLADRTVVNNLSSQISDTLIKNSAASKEMQLRLEVLRDRLKDLGLSAADVEKIRIEFTELKSEIKATGKVGDSFSNKIKKKFKDVAAYFATYVSIQDAIQVIRRGFDTIVEYDKALTEMNKVSKESIQTLKEFQKESFDLADTVGTTASQIQNSTADWMRLGETLEQAKQSAQDANILFNVSEFESIDAATESLVSMSQAYKDLEKGEIIDVVNNLGNNFAISTDGLATALQNSASALTTAKNDFFEAAALTTAANTVVQDPDKVGAGLRTIALRLTGTEAAREELASLGEDVDDFVITTASKLDQQIKDLTKTQDGFGVSLLDMNGNYRSTYEVLLDIAKVWEQIAEEDLATGENRQNALLEMMAGKNRSNILASILQSPEILQEAYDAALNSEGSALKENEAYLESIAGHLNQLKNAWDSLWINENNREVITFFLDLAKSILETVNEFGVLNTVLFGGGGLFAAIKSFKGEGRPKCSVSY